ncbi:hypothetical protein QUW13_10815 [Enterococcus hirae]|nr:hypothetical protein [Enterococcus hirae]
MKVQTKKARIEILANFPYTDQTAERSLKLSKEEKRFALKQMKNAAERFLNEEYQLPLAIPLVINGRTRATFGQFKLLKKGTQQVPKELAISEQFLALARFDDAKQAKQIVMDVLRHELIHYALFTENKPYRDGEPFFEAELARLGISSSGATARRKQLSAVRLDYYEAIDVYRWKEAGSQTVSLERYRHTKKDYSTKTRWFSRQRVALEIRKIALPQ